MASFVVTESQDLHRVPSPSSRFLQALGVTAEEASLLGVMDPYRDQSLSLQEITAAHTEAREALKRRRSEICASLLQELQKPSLEEWMSTLLDARSQKDPRTVLLQRWSSFLKEATSRNLPVWYLCD